MWGTEQYDQLDDCSSLVYMCLMEARQKKVARMAGVVVVDRIFPPFFPLAQSPRFSKQSLLLNAGSVVGIQIAYGSRLRCLLGLWGRSPLLIVANCGCLDGIP